MMEAVLERMIPGLQSDPRDQQVRMRAGTVGSAVGIVVNLLLTAGKAFAGVLMGSVAVTADAVNNLSDAAGSVMALVTMRLAQKPIDNDHPYGHGRMEYLGALGVGVIILVMAAELLHSSVAGILSPEPVQFSWWMLGILALSIAAKAWLWRFYSRLGRQIDSSALLATAKDAMSDAISTTAVLLCMIAARFTTLPLDGIMGLVVAVLVGKTGLDVCRDTVDNLLGGKPDPELGREIIALIEKREGILGTHDLMVHDYGPGRCVASIHAEVSAEMPIVEAHELVDLAEQEVGLALNIPLCIHMDPVVTGDDETNRAKAAMVECLHRLNSAYMLHDFRRVPGEKKINLIFDVVVPAELHDRSAVTAALQQCAEALDPRCSCVIHYDIDYYHA